MRAFTVWSVGDVWSRVMERMDEIDEVRKRVNMQRAWTIAQRRAFWRRWLPKSWTHRPKIVEAIIEEPGFDKCEWHGYKEDRLKDLDQVCRHAHQAGRNVLLDDEAILLLTTPIK
jgi:hypothetical protein